MKTLESIPFTSMDEEGKRLCHVGSWDGWRASQADVQAATTWLGKRGLRLISTSEHRHPPTLRVEEGKGWILDETNYSGTLNIGRWYAELIPANESVVTPVVSDDELTRQCKFFFGRPPTDPKKLPPPPKVFTPWDELSDW